MVLPTTGPLSLSQVNVELNRAATAQISLNDAEVRALFERSTGAISLSDGLGKANVFVFTIAGNNNDVNLRDQAVAAGWNAVAPVSATIASGAVLNGSGPSPAIRINGSFPNGVTLTNNGTIAGRAGNGAVGGAARGDQGATTQDGRTLGIAFGGSSGGNGHPALIANVAVTVFNNGTIAGGGGGGGGGGATIGNQVTFTSGGKDQPQTTRRRRAAAAGGGGGGAGRGNNFGNSGGAGGIRVRGSTFSIGNIDILREAAAGGGSNLSVSGGGGFRGEERDPGDTHAQGGDGGAGGFFGAAGASGQNSQFVFPTANARTSTGGAGGAGGPAVQGNNNITWGATGTRFGALQA